MQLRDRVRAPAPGRGPRLPRRRAPRRRSPAAALDERMEALRAWQARCHEAGYVGRAWPTEFGGGGAPAGRADHHRPGAGGGRRAGVRQRRRPRRARAVAAALRHRRAAPPLHPGDPRGRGDLVPGLLRARTPGRTSRRCARAPRSATTTSWSAGRRPGSRGGSSPAGAACSPAPSDDGPPPRDLDADRRHALARRRAAPDDADHRPRGVLRAVPRRRRRPAGEPARRARRRLEDRHAHARPRARHGRAAAPGQAAHLARPRRPRRGRAHVDGGR